MLNRHLVAGLEELAREQNLREGRQQQQQHAPFRDVDIRNRPYMDEADRPRNQGERNHQGERTYQGERSHQVEQNYQGELRHQQQVLDEGDPVGKRIRHRQHEYNQHQQHDPHLQQMNGYQHDQNRGVQHHHGTTRTGCCTAHCIHHHSRILN